MKICLILFFFICLVSGCSGKKDIPSSVIQPDKMELILWDLLRAQELAQHNILPDSVQKVMEVHTTLYEKVFMVHHTNKEDFTASLNFYQGRPDLLKPIFDSLNSKSEKLVQLTPPQ